MTLAGYQAAGRVQGAIAKTADRIYQQELDATEQRIARHIFLSLTELGEGAADPRRRVALDQLVTTAAQRAQVDAVLAELTKARLVITGEEASPDTDTEHKVTVKRVADGRVSNWMNDRVRAGDVLETMRPAGVFVLQDRATPRCFDKNLVVQATVAAMVPAAGATR